MNDHFRGTLLAELRSQGQGQAIVLIRNGYWGERLGGGALTQRERAETTKLRTYFEQKGRVLILEPV